MLGGVEEMEAASAFESHRTDAAWKDMNDSAREDEEFNQVMPPKPQSHWSSSRIYIDGNNL